MTTMPRIHIEKQDALIGIKTTNAQMQINTPRPKMKVNAPMPTMEAERQLPSFKVDWQRVRSESGLPAPGETTKKTTGDAKQQAHDYTGQVAQDGSYVAKTELGGNRIATLERQRTFEEMPEVNVGTMPQTLPNIQWEPGFIHITWSNTQMQVEWDTDYMPTFSVEPHSVEIFLRNKPYIRITVTEDPVGLVDDLI